MNNTQKSRRKNFSRLYFVATVLVLYLVLFLFHPERIRQSLQISGNVLLRLVPVFLFVIIVMAGIDYFFRPGTISKYVGKKSGFKGWVLAIGTGILSHGPIYAWYPALQELKEQGMRTGLITAFLYNRAIKIPLLPVMVYYFGMPFVAILLVLMIFASVVEGTIIEMLE